MSAATADVGPVYASTLTIRADNTGSRTRGPDRRSRAAAINAAKRAWEREHGLRLSRNWIRRDEMYGFAHRTEINYTVHCSGCTAVCTLLPFCQNQGA